MQPATFFCQNFLYLELWSLLRSVKPQLISIIETLTEESTQITSRKQGQPPGEKVAGVGVWKTRFFTHISAIPHIRTLNMDAYFINTLKVQKRVFFHVSFMSSCTSLLYRLSDLTHIPRTMQPIISFPSEKHAGMLTLKQTKTPRLALKSAYFFLSGGPKLAVVSPTSDECSSSKKYSSSASFWFDFLCSLIVFH